MLDKFLETSVRREVSAIIDEVCAVAQAENRVEISTHCFYRYPACFNPKLIRVLLGHFSRPGDTVLDPFMGGATTAVEASLLARNYIGIDINELAVFSGKLKTLRPNRGNAAELDKWVYQVINLAYARKPLPKLTPEERGLFLSTPEDISRVIKKSLELSDRLSPKARLFARGVILYCSKSALDGTKSFPTQANFLESIQTRYEEMIEKSLSFAAEASTAPGLFNLKKNLELRLINGDTTDRSIFKPLKGPVDLVLTSPPYPGISVLYDRWQIEGRRETHLPYWIIGSKQRRNSSFFTMGHPKTEMGLNKYFTSLELAFTNIRKKMKQNGLLIQVVAFSDKRSQFSRFMDCMSNAGFAEINNLTSRFFDGRIWRSVPRRKWYTNLAHSRLADRKEVVLFFRKKQ